MVLKAFVSGFSLPSKSCPARQQKTLATDQACWYLNDRSFYEEFGYGNLILIEVSTRQVYYRVEMVKDIDRPSSGLAAISTKYLITLFILICLLTFLNFTHLDNI